MTKLMTLSAAALTAFLVSAGSASADSWTRTWHGPNGGTATKTTTCGYHACGYTAQATGPNGRTWSSSGGVVRGPYRTHSYRAVTGPEGNTVVTRRVWPRYYW